MMFNAMCLSLLVCDADCSDGRYVV